MTSQNIGHHLSYWMINMKEVKRNNWMAKPFTIIWVSVLSSILILVICYLQNNIAYAFFDDINHFSKLEYIKRQLSNSQRNDSDVLYINIAYDKKLIIDEFMSELLSYFIHDFKGLSDHFRSNAVSGQNCNVVFHLFAFLRYTFKKSACFDDLLDGFRERMSAAMEKKE